MRVTAGTIIINVPTNIVINRTGIRVPQLNKTIHLIVYGADFCVCNSRTAWRGRGWSVVLCSEGG